MNEELSRTRSRSGRARKRTIRAHAAHTGLAYSVAARQVAAAGLRAGETLGSYGRTVYPVAAGGGRWSLSTRAARSAEERMRDAQLAAHLPGGRARHLAERFPPARAGHEPVDAGHGPVDAGHGPVDAGHGPVDAGHGPLYAGDGREDLLAMLYLVVFDAAPTVGELALAAQTGEEAAVDAICAGLDRAARLLLDGDWTILWDRIDGVLTAGVRAADDRVCGDASHLQAAFRGFGEEAGAPWSGARQILDALLVVADDGHAPGTRIRSVSTSDKAEGTIVGAGWDADGPPIGYDVWFDGAAGPRRVRTGDIVVLPRQEST
jgi:hypothetical protein